MTRGRTPLDRIRPRAFRLGIAKEERRLTEPPVHRIPSETYRAVLDSMREGFQIIGSDWRYVYLNDVAAAHGQRRKEELLGRTLMECYPGIEATEMFGRLRRCMETRESQSLENQFTYPDGSARWFALSVEAAPEGIFVISLDITDRVRAEQEVRSLNAELERRVRERTLALERANADLEAFSYSVSHDLRQPLRAIDGFGQVLLEDHAGQLDVEGRETLGRVRAAAQRMGELIDDLLRLSRVARVPLERQPVDISALARELVVELRERDPVRDTAVAVEEGLVAQADAKLLRIALENLLGNAWKFTRNTPGARITVGMAREDGQEAFFVRDNGAGFDMAHADKLFSPFQRLHSPREFEGTGIGLAIVAAVVRRHGGTVRAEAAVGRGTTVSFTLPPKEGAE